jgi:uncharacterized membrane protein (UPF0127 family)
VTLDFSGRVMTLRRAHTILVPKLGVAEKFLARTKGLIGCKHLPEGCALWIPHCNAVHTFFMSFTIDLIFLDRRMIVRKTISRLRPWRLTLPAWGATSVIELRGGFLDKHPIAVGEQLQAGEVSCRL